MDDQIKLVDKVPALKKEEIKLDYTQYPTESFSYAIATFLATYTILRVAIIDGVFSYYDTTKWCKLNRSDAYQFLHKLLSKLFGTNMKINKKLLKSLLEDMEVTASYRQHKDTPFVTMLNLEDSTLEIHTDGTVTSNKHSYLNYITTKLNITYDPNAKCDLWQNFLNEVLPDKNSQKILQEFLGWSLSRGHLLKMEKMLFLIGTGANGKSLIYDVVNHVLGEHNVSKLDFKDISNNQARIMLEDKLINYSPDSSAKVDEMMKKLVSGEPLPVKIPYESPRLITVLPKCIVNTNILPDSSDLTHSIFRRFIILNLDVTIAPDKQDKQLAYKIYSTEAAGILNWMIEGLQRLAHNQQFTDSINSNKALEELRLDLDHVKLHMEEDWEIISDNESGGERATVLFETYIVWCKYCGYKPLTLRTFIKRVRSLGYKDYKNSTTHFKIKKKSVEGGTSPFLAQLLKKKENND
jgi:putative DNA primase/helicase